MGVRLKQFQGDHEERRGSTTKFGGMWILHLGPRLGIERCGKINSVNSVSANCTGMGVMPGFLAVVRIMGGPHVKKVDLRWRIQISPHTTRGSARLQNSQPVLQFSK
jgi:hypothetical protein